ncbi:acyltransferase family protein [Pontibacter sp. MBLB2868]|uniref:acyltransferase family protein n=1 Tax=Pontibacter sp. MBLB2868 TaxID=3451555 RepID=UPI003F74FE4C
MKKHYQQIDVLKGLAILAVIALHSLPKKELYQFYAAYHIWQAVPVFMVLMGLNLGLSMAGKYPKPEQLYTGNYFEKKAGRLLIPFLLIFLSSYILGLTWQVVFHKNVLEFSLQTLIGLLPVTGSGNYFITLLLQSILFLPVIGYSLYRYPGMTTLVLLLLEVLFLLWCKTLPSLNKDNYLYSAAFPRYFTAVAYGFWLAQFLLQPALKRIIITVIVTTGAIGAVYLYFISYTSFEIKYFRADWLLQNFMSFGYAALLTLMGLALLPESSNTSILKLLARLGKASYHIFLIQIIYFGLVPDSTNLLLNQAFCVSLGYAFYVLESPLKSVNPVKVT